MPQIPLILDTNDSERATANRLLRDLGIGQKEMAARLADRGDKSHNLTGIGDAGSPSQNPMAIGATPLPPHVEPNPPAPATVSVPPKDSNPMRVTATPNYIQPNVVTPAGRSGTTPSTKNPMGL